MFVQKEEKMKSETEMSGAQDTIYLCNFRVSVDGDWLCLKELQDVEFNMSDSILNPPQLQPNFAVRDPVLIERSNLVNISKLIVKELIEQSLKYGRMLDSDHMPLQHFFIVLEHVLRHGLKPKKGLLGPKKELWDILQMVEKYSYEAMEMTQSVRNLPTVRTHMGRARAWLRLALMQKKLADYLKILIDHKDDLALLEHFETDALMLSDEANVIIGLLTGLNVVDCNLCLKEEDLDTQQGVIDFSLYLRSTSQVDETADPTQENMTTVLDQKNYIEELNRHLNATVSNLQSKVEQLQTTNALMTEDLTITRNSLSAITEENKQLKRELGRDTSILPANVAIVKALPQMTAATNDSDNEKNERVLRAQLDETRKELDLQVCLKAEMEVAMKLLEKDIFEKQDTILSLRKQLDDIKQINLEMYNKLQENESQLKHKSELINKLQSKNTALSETINSLDQKYHECETLRANTELSSRELDKRVRDTQTATAHDLEREREMRRELEEQLKTSESDLERMHVDMKQLRAISNKFTDLQEEYYNLKEHCLEQEQTLEELGKQLSVAKLQVSDLEEARDMNRTGESVWIADKDVHNCRACAKDFNVTRRKHHCRNCGDIFCATCSDNQATLPAFSKPVRVCNACYATVAAAS